VQGRPDFGEAMPSTVVGVVGDVHQFGLDAAPEPQVYVPFTRNVWGHMSLVVRTAISPVGLIATLRRTVRQVDPDIPITLGGGAPAVGTIDVTGGLASRELDTWLLGGFATCALLLAAIGVYGLFAYSVAQRRHEMGIRVALGASERQVLGLIVGDGMRLAAIGIALGAAGALVLTRLLAGLLYGIGASDPGTFGAAATLLGLVALLASYIPARRAARVDPMVALRNE
jgi:putative ABC transport system permease protein